MECFSADCQSKCFSVINSKSLSESLCDEMCLVPGDITLGIMLVAEDEMGVDDVGAQRSLDNLPGA